MTIDYRMPFYTGVQPFLLTGQFQITGLRLNFRWPVEVCESNINQRLCVTYGSASYIHTHASAS